MSSFSPLSDIFSQTFFSLPLPSSSSVFHGTSPISEMFQTGGAPRSTDNRQEQILVNENKELKAKIKELQKVMDTELQNTDDQFLEKIKELEADHTRKIEEMEAFSFLVAQEAEVTSSFLLTPKIQNSTSIKPN